MTDGDFVEPGELEPFAHLLGEPLTEVEQRDETDHAVSTASMGHTVNGPDVL